MNEVLQHKKSAEETAERHSQEKADLLKRLEDKDKELAECKTQHAAAVWKLETKHAGVVKDMETKHAAKVDKLESKHAAAVKEMKDQFAADKKERADEAARKLQFDRGFYQQQLNVYDLESKKKLDLAKEETNVEVKKARMETQDKNNEWKIRAMIAEEQLAKLQQPSQPSSGSKKKAKP